MSGVSAGLRPRSTTGGRRCLAAWLVLVLLAGTACSGSRSPRVEAEAERESRTEFTARIENFFEFDPLEPGKTSHFLIHLTDLSDGAPVEKADVTLNVRGAGATPFQAKARVGKVTGIYVAEVTVPVPGTYDIEFRVKNAKLDERMPLTGFKTP
jgi:hypothetical protein